MHIAKILNLIPGYSAWRARQTIGAGGLDHAIIETLDETGYTTAVRANYALADIRDFLRNTSFGQAVLNQLQVNAVGTIGGRLAFSTSDDEFNARANKEWARYARFCGFADNASLNKILRDLVGCLFFNGGDALVVFDDGRLTGGRGTGKILIFESDQIANAPDAWFKRHYPAAWRQDRGVIYDQYNRPVGFFASAKRGLAELPVVGDSPQFLSFVDRHPDLDPEKRPFYFISRTWRPNQGRGVPTIIHVINELRNLEDMQKAETQAAKLNSHLALAVKEDASAADILTADAIMSGKSVTPPKVKFDAILRQQSAILQLPKGKDIVSFDTKRPNERVVDYIDEVKSVIVAAFGLGKQFYTLTPESSFTAHRGAMQMAWQSIAQLQTDLNAFCNWLASQWFYWRRTDPRAETRLAVTDDILSDIDFCTEWAWPQMPEVDSAKAESTIQAAMQNGTKTYRDIVGPEWRRKVDERKIERDYFAAANEVYPGDRMVTGGIATTDFDEPSNDDDPNQNKKDTDDVD